MIAADLISYEAIYCGWEKCLPDMRITLLTRRAEYWHLFSI